MTRFPSFIRIRLSVVAVLSFYSGALVPVAAQGVTVGQRVRVTAPEAGIRNRAGELVALDAGALIIRRDDGKWTIPREQLTRLEVTGGRKGHWLTGLLIGAGVGFLGGMIAIEGGGSGICEGSGDYYDDMCRAIVASTTVVGAGLGAGVGALLKSDRWVPVPLETLTPAIGFARGLGPLPSP